MARKRSPPSIDGKSASVPMFHATVRYKQWVRAQLEDKGWSLARLAAEMKRAVPSVSITDAAISQFLGPEDAPAGPSNTAHMPAINKVFGIPPPPVCDPLDPIAQIRDRFTERWLTLDDRERRAIHALLDAES